MNTQQRRGRRNGPFGFTLLEVIAVLLIMGVVAAVLFAGSISTDEYRAKSQAEVIKSHLRHAQSQAMNSSVVWGIHFIDGSRYAMFKDGNTGVQVQIAGADSNPVDLSGQGITISNLGSGIVSFNSWGTPHTDAQAVTAQSGTRTLTVTKGDVSESIQITPNTGYIP
ncbi:MAG: type II secretion system protein [Pseudomonadota bacterium]|nr:type II secretion system protein [Pseudomonadota bacterium]